MLVAPSPIARARIPSVVVAVIVAALATVTWLGLDLSSWPDWTIEAQTSVTALMAGHLGTFLRTAPVYGASLLLRAPFMELAHLWHGGGRAVYRLSALPCLAALGGLAWWMSRAMALRGCGLLAQATAAALCVGNPLVVPALQLGHPEDLLGAVLCVASVLCAQRDRAVLSGILVGVATANKQWGLLAAGPVLVALDSHRGRSLAAMVAAAGILMAPLLLVSFGDHPTAGVVSGGIFNPWQLWWFLGAHAAHAQGAQRVGPAWLSGLGHTLPVALMPALTLAYLRGRDRAARRGPDAFLLLALVMLLRCALDPWDISYYALPFMLALLMWETSAHDRPPLVTLLATFAGWAVLQETTAVFGNAQDTLAFVYALAAVPAIGLLLGRLYLRATGVAVPEPHLLPA